MKTKYICILLALVVIFSCTLLYLEYIYKNNVANFTVVHSSDGVWDLSEYDLTDTVVLLSGNVKYIPGEILSPSEFEELKDTAQIGSPTDHNSATTAKITLIMPKEVGNAISVRGDYARAVYLNDDYIGAIGTPADSAEKFEAMHGTIVFPANTNENGEIELIIQGGNFVHRQSSGYTTIHISNQNLLTWFLNYDLLIEAFTGALFFCLFILFFAMMFITQNYRMNIYFSFLCLLWTIRLGLTGSKFFYSIIPNLSWQIAFRLEYIALALIIAFLVKIIYLHMPQLKWLSVLNYLTYPLYILSVFFLFLDTYIMSYAVPILSLLYIAIIIYISLVVFIHTYIKKDEVKYNFTDKVFLFGLVILFICSVNDALYYNNLHLVMTTLTETSVLIFSFFEAIVIFHLSMVHMEKIKFAAKQEEMRAKELEHFLELKSHFLGIVAHEIKTPLSVIMGLSADTLDIIREDFDFHHENFDLVIDNQMLISNTVKSLNETVFDLVDTTALETGRLGLSIAKMNMKNLILSVSHQYKTQIEKNKNTLILNIDNCDGVIFADEKRMRQVLLNLLSNACKHAPSSDIIIKLWQNEDYMFVSVADTGAGIPNSILEKLKKEYSKKDIYRYSGGIGLYVSHQIIHSHQGKIDIISEKGKGCTIEFALPIENKKEL